ncbi:DMT family transporter [Pseudaminobacter sp. 19-2017]|uniref:DMT family transporter n=1 Tax=Pseudaminobacter soli (ex Zhang et al. 2022) TaxID=2831468 RepID=A0A942DYQ2_9HYPH|nr:DMT family transporter [Pseudaminobacter soli]MBS3647470.1 DMT family transporter [Pseudaminobacter soli]
MHAYENRAAGIACIIGSTVFFASAGIFTKLTAADAWTIAGWRGLVGGVLIAAYAYWRGGHEARQLFPRLGIRGWMLTAAGAVSSIFFIGAFKATYVANVAAIYATVPFWAAGLDFLLRGLPARKLTMAISVVSVLGVLIIVSGGLGAGKLHGDLLALGMTLASALYLVMIRAFTTTPVMWAGAVMGFLLFVVSWFVTDPLAISSVDALIIGGFGVSYAAAVILWTEGGRRLPAAEAGLLGAAEVPFAVLAAWMFLAELPPYASVLGGLIVLSAVLVHAGADLAADARRKPGPAAEHPGASPTA